MITAETARFKSKYQRTINGIIDDIEKKINEAILNGEYKCRVNIDPDINHLIKNEVFRIVENNGYKIKDRFSPFRNPIDISWEDEVY